MKLSRFEIPFIIGLFTALCIVIYEGTNLLLVYKYFKFDYYLAIVALVFLCVGLLIARRKSKKESPEVSETADPKIQLTSKEFQILSLISEGKTNKEIAALNYVEVCTVKTHINNLYAKLGIKNRKEATEIFDNQYKVQKSTLIPPPVF